MCIFATTHTGERKWEVLGQKGHSDAIFALAVPAWHRTVPYIRCQFSKSGKKRSYRTVLYYRTPYRAPYCNCPDSYTMCCPRVQYCTHVGVIHSLLHAYPIYIELVFVVTKAYAGMQQPSQ
jgi:hypothetical protein